jgi:hypothetical protein
MKRLDSKLGLIFTIILIVIMILTILVSKFFLNK